MTLVTSDGAWSVWQGARWLGWNEIWDHVSEILREPSSHLVSALQGDRYVPHPSERAAWAVFETWLNTQMRKGSGHRRVSRPWAGEKPIYADASPEVEASRAARRAKLAALF